MTRPGIEPRSPGPLANTLTAGPMTLETRVRSQVESYQRLKKWYLMPLLNTRHYKVWVKGKWSNPGKGVVPRCSSYWKGSLWVALDYSQLTTYIFMFLWWKQVACHRKWTRWYKFKFWTQLFVFPFYANAFEKGMNPPLLLLALHKMLEQAGLFNPGSAIKLKSAILCLKTDLVTFCLCLRRVWVHAYVFIFLVTVSMLESLVMNNIYFDCIMSH